LTGTDTESRRFYKYTAERFHFAYVSLRWSRLWRVGGSPGAQNGRRDTVSCDVGLTASRTLMSVQRRHAIHPGGVALLEC